MDYIEGNDLRKLLLRRKPVDSDYLSMILKSVGNGLAKFHKTFIKPDWKSKKNLENYCSYWRIRGETKISLRRLKKSRLNYVSSTFGDISPDNILVKNDKAYLIDFPSPSKKGCIGPPHIDLARFKYSLYRLNLYPHFNFLPLDWWSPEKLFEQFAEGYQNEIDSKINNIDKKIIKNLLKEYVITERNKIKNTKNQSIKGKLTNIYHLYMLHKIKKETK
ncbi:hypothetical protein QEN48_01155 [Methanonatronarchaeum sp. AMET-Sl]|nr:hypothetical protein [Methanonatronarchaeum sp. AMET-Sl]WGI17646.1 hypothetical protein QEN48_01155 [Methanonatronarchaeum sp. AMET-Sl]